MVPPLISCVQIPEQDPSLALLQRLEGRKGEKFSKMFPSLLFTGETTNRELFGGASPLAGIFQEFPNKCAWPEGGTSRAARRRQMIYGCPRRLKVEADSTAQMYLATEVERGAKSGVRIRGR